MWLAVRTSAASHEFAFEPDSRGAAVQATVVNRSDSRIDIAEIWVRVYNPDEQLIGRYVDSVGDFDSAKPWSFMTVLLEAPEEIASDDIAALRTPV